tara:strand:- start:207 stop:749 length:543 start_codon:yes stop_codon:yes gene_type:complete
MKKEVTLVKNCIATIIPAGDEITLAEGAHFVIAQSLGGSVTLRDDNGMYRVGEDQLSALGDDIVADVVAVEEKSENKPFSEEVVWDALRGCYDPEIPVNIVDLGLVYDLTLDGEGESHTVDVKMTLTAQGCGMGPVIADDAKTRIESIAQVESVTVSIVWDPPWNPRMMSEQGKKALGLE